jgi:hypothetical protein
MPSSGHGINRLLRLTDKSEMRNKYLISQDNRFASIADFNECVALMSTVKLRIAYRCGMLADLGPVNHAKTGSQPARERGLAIKLSTRTAERELAGLLANPADKASTRGEFKPDMVVACCFSVLTIP